MGATEEMRRFRVFDDGAKTYIQKRPEVQHQEPPMLVLLGSDGKGENEQLPITGSDLYRRSSGSVPVRAVSRE